MSFMMTRILTVGVIMTKNRVDDDDDLHSQCDDNEHLDDPRANNDDFLAGWGSVPV